MTHMYSICILLHITSDLLFVLERVNYTELQLVCQKYHKTIDLMNSIIKL
jgi:hypothetical protein